MQLFHKLLQRPYLELQNLYDLRGGTVDSGFNSFTDTSLAETPVAAFNCPSRFERFGINSADLFRFGDYAGVMASHCDPGWAGFEWRRHVGPISTEEERVWTGIIARGGHTNLNSKQATIAALRISWFLQKVLALNSFIHLMLRCNSGSGRIRQPGKILVCLTALGLLLGCGESDPADLLAAANDSNIQRLANLYQAFQSRRNWRSPNDEAELKAFLKGWNPKKLSRIGVDPAAIDDLFVSSRDGEPFKIRYGVPGHIMGSDAPVVFESLPELTANGWSDS